MPRQARHLAVGLLVLCATTASAGEPVPLDRLAPDVPLSNWHSGIQEAGHHVVADPAAWQTIWARIQGPRQPVPPAPRIDFQRNLVVVAAMGRQPSGGYSIRIERAWHEGDRVIVLVREESPGAGCMVTMALTTPIDVALLPVTSGPIEFRTESTVRDCDRD